MTDSRFLFGVLVGAGGVILFQRFRASKAKGGQ